MASCKFTSSLSFPPTFSLLISFLYLFDKQCFQNWNRVVCMSGGKKSQVFHGFSLLTFSSIKRSLVSLDRNCCSIYLSDHSKVFIFQSFRSKVQRVQSRPNLLWVKKKRATFQGDEETRFHFLPGQILVMHIHFLKNNAKSFQSWGCRICKAFESRKMNPNKFLSEELWVIGSEVETLRSSRYLFHLEKRGKSH